MTNQKIKDETVIRQTIGWINSVVIKCNFCPFAAQVVLQNTVRYVVLNDGDVKTCLRVLGDEFLLLDEEGGAETTLIILPQSFTDFYGYLNLIDKAERSLRKQDYEGVYQLATFHPQYCFAGSDENDPANYTNRAPYPIIQILREDSITKALEKFADPDSIPERNIRFAQEKGLEFMKHMLASTIKV